MANNQNPLDEIFTNLINLVRAQSNQLKVLADKIEQLEVGSGGGNATIVDYTPGTTYKRNALVVYNETVYRILPEEYVAVDFDTDYSGGKLKLVGFESGIVTYGQDPTQAQVDTLPEDTLVAIYNSTDDPYNLT